ncbi:Hypothetical predicted protein [Octopus vulgaris]|uniref:Uncharacterized protein n=1 Tax=Octopus vulgaris TaxID=6645 RepID=A0AA36AFA2_OCTVU|nr:Hypothetical predicted protein [Octopus vulgaris]
MDKGETDLLPGIIGIEEVELDQLSDLKVLLNAVQKIIFDEYFFNAYNTIPSSRSSFILVIYCCIKSETCSNSINLHEIGCIFLNINIYLYIYIYMSWCI